VSEKTEDATDKKLDEAREKGQVPRSKDLTSAFAFAFGIAALIATAGDSASRVHNIIHTAMLAAAAGATDGKQFALQAAYAMAGDALWIVVPVLGAAAAGGVVGGIAHVGFLVSFEPLTPKFDKLDPVAGMKRIFSMSSLVEVGKSLVQAVLITWLLYHTVISLLPKLVVSGYGLPDTIGHTAWVHLLKVLLLCTLLFIVLGVADFAIQKLIFMRQQRMSKDEVKREWKEQEGDPQLKGKRKALAHELANEAPKIPVAMASAVVVNPTHYAVALRYAPDECGLPFVVAKGVDDDAALIREAAKAAGVPIIGNPPLARSLYTLDINATVPEPMLEAVAIVLRWAHEVRAQEPA
jgi:type III secretion protein U